MKIVKTTVHRLEIERECGCKASREYEDARYTKPIAEGTTTLCEKHGKKSDDAQEILREMILDTLTMQAETAGKSALSGNPFRPVTDDVGGGGIVATGESVEVFAGVNLPKRNIDSSPRPNRTRDPLSITKVSVDRPTPTQPKTASSAAEQAIILEGTEGITITGNIDTVAEDPRLSGVLEEEIENLEDVLDEMDMKDAGLSRSLLNQAK